MKQISESIEKMFSDRELQEDEYRNEADNLIYCNKCNTPRQHHVAVLGKEMIVPIPCRCQQEQRDKEESERKQREFMEQVFNIIDSRYRSKLPLIVTTNMTLDELKHPQDLARSRIYDRVLERCAPLKINNQNIRQKNATENIKEARRILEIGTGT